MSTTYHKDPIWKREPDPDPAPGLPPKPAADPDYPLLPSGRNLAAIPQVLRDQAFWVCGRWSATEWVKDTMTGRWTAHPGARWAKRFYSASTGLPAKTNDPTTWGAFMPTLAACHRHGYDFIGLALCPSMLPLVGIDMDHCVGPAPDRTALETAYQITEALQSWTCLSVSGGGLRTLVLGTKPGPVCRGRDGLPVEMYFENRFLTITAQVESGLTELREGGPALEQVYAQFWAPADPPPAPPPPTNLRAWTGGGGHTDAEVLGYLDRERGGTWQSLQHAPPDRDDSADDYAMACKIGFHSGDAAQVERIMRTTPRVRAKWSQGDYLGRTIRRALAAVGRANHLTQRIAA